MFLLIFSKIKFAAKIVFTLKGYPSGQGPHFVDFDFIFPMLFATPNLAELAWQTCNMAEPENHFNKILSQTRRVILFKP